MSKYTQQQLKEIAIESLELQKKQPQQFQHMLNMLCTFTGVDFEMAYDKIVEYSKYETDS